MTIGTLLDKVGSAANRRLDQKVEHVAAVYDDQLWTILTEMGLIDALDAGHLRCHYSGIPLTRDNLGAIVNTPAGPRLIADSSIPGAPFGRPAGR